MQLHFIVPIKIYVKLTKNVFGTLTKLVLCLFELKHLEFEKFTIFYQFKWFLSIIYLFM